MRQLNITVSLLLLTLLATASTAVTAALHTLMQGDQEIIVETHLVIGNSRKQAVLSWIDAVSSALASVYGRMPREQLRVEVTPVGIYTRDPVPWAQVRRGEPDTVLFYIDALASDHKLIHNWTAYHEFSHLLIPYRGWGDMWFSEGLASYYQNLLQVRSGVLREDEMWQRLYDGFMRGRNNNRRPQVSLDELSSQMHETRSYMRVYWSGAWYFLNADVTLRRLSDNRQTLDSVLGRLNRCCAEQQLSARQIARRLDVLSQERVFEPLFERVSKSREVPDFETLFQQLGITVVAEEVRLNNTGEDVAIRRGISRQK